MHLGWQVLDQKGEGLVNRFGLNNVVVVKDEDKIIRNGGDFVEQSCQKRFGWWWLRLRSVEHSQDPFSNIRHNHLQSSNEVSQKASKVVVAFIQGKPSCWHLTLVEPIADQGSFPKAGRSGDEGQLAM